MSTTAVRDSVSTGRGTGQHERITSPRPSAALRLKVRATSASLDRRIAGGEFVGRDSALELRARQLVGTKHRHSLARSLMGVVEQAQQPHQRGPRAPVDRRAVNAARVQMVELSYRLENPAPVSARGAAMLTNLLRDGSGPLYAANLAGEQQSQDELSNRLDHVANTLEAVL